MAKGAVFRENIIVQAIATETGEVLLQHQDSNIEVRILSAKEQENYKNKIGIVQLKKGRFIKFMKDKIPQMAECLSTEAFSLAMRLTENICVRDNCLIISDNQKLKLKDIQEMLDVSKTTAIKYVKELIENDIIKQFKCDLGKCYFYNPFIARKTNDILLDIFNLFVKTRWNDSESEKPEMIIWKDKRTKYDL